MRWSFKTSLLVLLGIIAALALVRLSPIKLVEQDLIAYLQSRLSPAQIHGFQVLSNTISYISLTIPALFIVLGFLRNRKEWRTAGLYVLLSIALAGLMGAIVKRVIREPRPYEVDTRIVQHSHGGSNSFPSGHTAEATVAALGISFLLLRNRFATIVMLFWALMMMLSRIVLGVHNVTDILAGISFALLGMLLMNRIFQRYRVEVWEDAGY